MLRLLAKEHPKTVDLVVLCVLLERMGFAIDVKECEGDIEYLYEKGFVKREVKKVSGIRIVIVSISAKGLDLIDGLIEDVGVEAGSDD